ncbi:MAG: hypothetical protein SFV81_29940 [Pirellulaceae bacterium]|nr:hypothetical protein [Pirellulaceae bacterium]
MRRIWQSDFWLALAVLMFGACGSFGQVLIRPDVKQERIDRYYSLVREESWSEALEMLQSFSSDDIPEYFTDNVRLRILTGDYDDAVRLVESNEQAITDAWSFAALGRWYLYKSPSKCRAFLTRSLDIDPSHDATQTAIVLADQQKDLRFAMESLRKLHKRHPRYMGGYSVDLGFQLDKSDREFGKDQVTKVCRDRPKLAVLISGSPRIQEWLIQRFGGMFIGRRAAWSNTRPGALKFDHSACHAPASPFADAIVWVNPELEGEHQLATLVYELLNAENSDESNDAWAKVWNGELDRENYVRELGKLEHRALLKRRAFFVVEYFAGGLPETISPEPWYLHVNHEFEEYFKLQPKFINEYYANFYDEVQKFRRSVGATGVKPQ